MRAGDNRRARDRARLALRPAGAGGGIHPRPRTDRRRDGRPRAGGHRDHRRAHGFYDYESKYADGGSRHVIPAAIHPRRLRAGAGLALAAHRALGCRGATRADFRYDDTAGEPGRLVLLEVNTQPGLTPTSLLPEQAAHLRHRVSRRCAPGWWSRPHAAREPRRARATRCNDRPGRLEAAAGAGSGGCCARPAGSLFAGAGAAARLRRRCIRPRPAASWRALRERLGDATARRSGLRVQRRRDRGPRTTRRSRCCAPRSACRAAIRSWASRSTDARARIETLSWVEHATVERRLPGTIVVQLDERRPFAVWQNQGKFVLIDRDGQMVTDQDVAQLRRPAAAGGRRRRAGGGGGAARCADRAARHCRRACVAAVRVGERRWNLRLNNGTDVLLPEGARGRGAGPAAWSCSRTTRCSTGRCRWSICGCPTGWWCGRRRKPDPAIPRKPRRASRHDRRNRGEPT